MFSYGANEDVWHLRTESADVIWHGGWISGPMHFRVYAFDSNGEDANTLDFSDDARFTLWHVANNQTNTQCTQSHLLSPSVLTPSTIVDACEGPNLLLVMPHVYGHVEFELPPIPGPASRTYKWRRGDTTVINLSVLSMVLASRRLRQAVGYALAAVAAWVHKIEPLHEQQPVLRAWLGGMTSAELERQMKRFCVVAAMAFLGRIGYAGLREVDVVSDTNRIWEDCVAWPGTVPHQLSAGASPESFINNIMPLVGWFTHIPANVVARMILAHPAGSPNSPHIGRSRFRHVHMFAHTFDVAMIHLASRPMRLFGKPTLNWKPVVTVGDWMSHVACISLRDLNNSVPEERGPRAR